MKLCISVCKAENCETEMKFHFEKTNMYVGTKDIHRNRMNGIPLVFQNSRWLGLESRLMDVAECETKVSVLFATTS